MELQIYRDSGAGGNGLAALSGSWKKQNWKIVLVSHPHIGSLIFLSCLIFLFCRSHFPGIAGILIKEYDMNFCLSFEGNWTLEKFSEIFVAIQTPRTNYTCYAQAMIYIYLVMAQSILRIISII